MVDRIAVVGLSCRLPGGITTVDELWAALSEGRELVGDPPPDRFDTRRFQDANPVRPAKSYTFAGGFLDDIAGFDAEYFGISPREASRIDPQQRLLLEMAVEACDDAGLPREAVAGSDTGVFVGASSPDYGGMQTSSPETIDPYTNSGMALSNTANRISYALDLHGPSVKVDTACASSLNAVHLACQYLRHGEGGLALAAGVNVLLNPYIYIGFAKATILSPSGRCRPFSAKADGYVRAEGGGVVVLKRLTDAVADGDRIHGVIVASGTNSDGRTAGLVLPSAETQEALLREVYARAELEPADLAYLEAHGTGTPIGDPIECQAIGGALATGRAAETPLPIGSIKGNLGHLEPASGMAGLLKALLVLRYRTIPPAPASDPLSTEIDFAELGIDPVLHRRALEPGAGSLVGVNSFGFGGTNTHVVLAPAAEREPRADRPAAPLPITVSARSADALGAAVRRFGARLAEAGPDSHYDLAYTSCLRRSRHPHRAVFLADTSAVAAERMLDENAPWRQYQQQAVPHGRIAFAFSGNGSQWPRMGADLIEAEPVFRRAVQRVDAVFAPKAGWSLLDEFEVDTAPAGGSGMDDTEIAQPALFAVQVAIVELLAQHGIRPDAVYGHSVGEITAAYLAGVLDLEQALEVVLVRSQEQAATAGLGRMAAVALGRAEIEPLLTGDLELAAVNSGRDVTVAGPPSAVRELVARLAERDVFCQPLGLDYAFHSGIMDPIRRPLLERLTGLHPKPAEILLVSTVTGGPVNGTELDASYWWRNVREPVRFAEATAELLESGCDTLVEIGPHPVLLPYLRRAESAGPIATIGTLRRDVGGRECVRGAVESVLAAGPPAGCERYFPVRGRVVDLPPYPWRREPHWHGDQYWWAGVPGPVDHPLLGDRAAVPEPTWESTVDSAALPWLTDHQVDGAAILPAAGYVEMALAAGRRVHEAPVELGELHILRPLALPEEDAPAPRLRAALSEEDGVFRISSRATGKHPWQNHARTRVRTLLGSAPAALDLAELRRGIAAEGQHVDAAGHYADARRLGVDYGSAFQVLTEAWATHGTVLARYDCRHLDLDEYETHPAWLDAALQAAIPLGRALGRWRTFLPVAIGRVRRWLPPTATGAILLVARRGSEYELALDATITDEAGTILVELSDCRLMRVPSEATEPPARRTVEPRAAPRPGPLPAVEFGSGPVVAAARESIGEFGRTRAEDVVCYLPGVKAMTAAFAARAFAELLGGATVFFTEDLLGAGVRPGYGRLLDRLSVLAHDHGHLGWLGELHGSTRWRLAGRAEPERLFGDLVWDYPEAATHLTLVARAGRHLVGVLTGQVDPIELVFPDSGADTITHFYDIAPTLRPFNKGAVEIVRAMVRNWPSSRPLRVLEIGAGTGGLTAAVLPELPRDRTRYVCTDITELFLAPAASRFAAYDFVEYHRFDLDQDPTEQGFVDGEFDLILAGLAVHVAKDLRRTLPGLARLLGAGGRLVLVEPHDVDLLCLPFGLFEQFWVTEDRDLRPNSPLLPVDQWTELLRTTGFRAVSDTACAQPPGDRVSIIVAERADPAASVIEPPRRGGSWFLLVDDPADRDLGRRLVERLNTTGATARMAEPATDPERWLALFGQDPDVRVVFLLGESVAENGSAAAVTTYRFQVACAVAEACNELAVDSSAGLWVVSRSADTVGPPAELSRPVDAAFWGATRVLASEYPRLTVRRVCMPRGEGEADRLTAELLDPDPDDEIILTAHGRFVPRLVEHAAPAGSAEGYRLRLRDRGPDYRLAWTQVDAPEPGPHQVVVSVRAAAINYRDTLLAVGMLPEWMVAGGMLGADLGFECSGIIAAVGAEVTAFRPGDRVLAFVPNAFASHVLADASVVGHLPGDLDYAEAVTMPVAYLTVHYGLRQLAQLEPGETVLVHGAAGAVGLAALRCARDAGATVIATAGTEEKRDFLRLLGVEQVYDSRGLDFAERIREAAGGHGVDVVLNSLAGEAITRSLELLRPGGRFVELGKRDIYLDQNVSLLPFRNNVSFFGVDIDQLARHRPRALARQYREMLDRVRDGVYRPLPYRAFPAARIAEAFRTVQHSRHIGKVVITFEEPPPVERRPRPLRLDPAATYLVTGGLSGLGGATASWLAERGARHLALLGRRGAGTAEAAAILEGLAARGVTATPYAVDVTDVDAMRATIESIDGTGKPLRGVVHAAMALDDGNSKDLTPERFRVALEPKMAGAMILDRLTEGRELDLFLLYSSASALVGNAGQANYCAGNLALEALCRDRGRRGLPATAVALGPIREVGYVARSEATTKLLERAGLGFIGQEEVFTAIDELIGRDGAVAIVMRRYSALLRLFPHLTTPRLGELTGAEEDLTDVADLLAELRRLPLEEAVPKLEDTIVWMVADSLGIAPERVDRTRPLDQLGVDSLMAAELVSKMRRRVGTELPIMRVLSSGDISELSRALVKWLQSASSSDLPEELRSS
ncbi:type I polyketide synthase [Amycolatopsis cihanbeyliensis]|nr:type I polyketide synthase [Amycolatopsis cihanbeyliensis]